MASRIAYADESIRSRHHWLGVAVVAESDVAALRRIVRSLCLPGQRQLHIKKEGDPRRRMIISALVGCGLVRGRVYRAPRPVVEARASCLAAVVDDLVDAGVGCLVLDRVDERQAVRDRHSLRESLRKHAAEMRYQHAPAWEEAGIQAADAAAWAYGIGGDWRRRIRPLVEEVREL